MRKRRKMGYERRRDTKLKEGFEAYEGVIDEIVDGIVYATLHCVGGPCFECEDGFKSTTAFVEIPVGQFDEKFQDRLIEGNWFYMGSRGPNHYRLTVRKLVYFTQEQINEAFEKAEKLWLRLNIDEDQDEIQMNIEKKLRLMYDPPPELKEKLDKVSIDQEIKEARIAVRLTARKVSRYCIDTFGDDCLQYMFYGEPWPEGLKEKVLEWINSHAESR